MVSSARLPNYKTSLMEKSRFVFVLVGESRKAISTNGSFADVKESTNCVGDGASRPFPHMREVARETCGSRFVGQEPCTCISCASKATEGVGAVWSACAICTCIHMSPGDASPVGAASMFHGYAASAIQSERRGFQDTGSDVSDGAACPRETPCVGRDACGHTRSLDPFERVHRAASNEVQDASTGGGHDAAVAARGPADGSHALLGGAMGRRASVRPSRERSGRGSRVPGAAAPGKRVGVIRHPCLPQLVCAANQA